MASPCDDKMSAEWREEQNRCLREIERHEAAEQSYMDEGVQILELARITSPT
jgi:site-specific DNA recombinase